MKIKAGQVLWLRLPFGKTDNISEVFHPYLILDIYYDHISVVEIGQMDSKNFKPYILIKEAGKLVTKENPHETVIYRDSYLQADWKIRVEYFDELECYLDTTDTLSEKKFTEVRNAYFDYKRKHYIEETKEQFFTKDSVLDYNRIDEWTEAQRKRQARYGFEFETITENL